MSHNPEQSRRMKIFVVIPLHNEEKHIQNVLKGINKYKLPVVIVDDGSTDNSKIKVRNLKIRTLKLLEHKINLGKGAAMKTGADFAFAHGADAIVFMDADAQHEPADLSQFINALESKKYDVVFGSRNYGYGVPLVRYLGNKFASVFISILFRVYVTDVICGFKGITKLGYKKLDWESSGYGVETEIVALVGKRRLKFTEVPVTTIYHDKVKGVTILDAVGILGDVLKWRLTMK